MGPEEVIEKVLRRVLVKSDKIQIVPVYIFVKNDVEEFDRLDIKTFVIYMQNNVAIAEDVVTMSFNYSMGKSITVTDKGLGNTVLVEVCSQKLNLCEKVRVPEVELPDL